MPNQIPRHNSKPKGSKARPNAARRGYDYQWQTVHRPAQLERNPLCEQCEREGRVTVAAEVDHIIPHRGHPDLIHDPDNLQSLCSTCHKSKTATYDRQGVPYPYRKGRYAKW